MAGNVQALIPSHPLVPPKTPQRQLKRPRSAESAPPADFALQDDEPGGLFAAFNPRGAVCFDGDAEGGRAKADNELDNLTRDEQESVVPRDTARLEEGFAR